MLGVRLLDPDVVDEETARVVVLNFYQSLGEELGECVDERINLEHPTLHLRKRKPTVCNPFSPGTVEQMIPIWLDVRFEDARPGRTNGYRLAGSHEPP